jgi:glycopeptide antibiotics resistance protein
MDVLRRRRAAGWALAAYTLALVALVFEPFPIAASGSVLFAYRTVVDLGAPSFITIGMVEVALNVVLFVPLVFLAGIVWFKVTWKQWVGIGLLMSSTIEFVQLLVLADRSATVSDIVSNTIGALLGALAARAVLARPEQASPSDGYPTENDLARRES